MSVPGAFFEVTGRESELDQIMEGIAKNDGRLTADSSASLDLWMEMKEEWFKLHDQKVVDTHLSTLDGATNEPAEGVRVSTPGEFAALWNARTLEEREKVIKMWMESIDGYQRCFIEDHDYLKEQLAASVNGQVVLAALRNIGLSLTDPKAVSDAVRFSNAKQGLASLITQIERQVPAPKPVEWSIEYVHPDCKFCEGAAEEAISHATQSGTRAAEAIGIDPMALIPEVHGAAVRRV